MSQKRAKAGRKAAKKQRGARADSIIGGKLPKCLYKYAPFNPERIRDALVNRQIWFADPKTLNDPFDCRVAPKLSTPEAREKWARHYEAHADISSHEEIREHMDRIRAGDPAYISYLVDREADDASKGFGVCCLTEKPDNLPMWAHYADNHEGGCYCFDLTKHAAYARQPENNHICFPFTFLRRLKYKKEYRTFLPEEAIREEVFLVKSKMWESENEWRALARPHRLWADFWEDAKVNCPPAHAKWLRKMFEGPGAQRLDSGLLFGVILGFRMAPSLKREVIAMAIEGGVKIFQARPKNFEYGMDIKPYEG